MWYFIVLLVEILVLDIYSFEMIRGHKITNNEKERRIECVFIGCTSITCFMLKKVLLRIVHKHFHKNNYITNDYGFIQKMMNINGHFYGYDL